MATTQTRKPASKSTTTKSDGAGSRSYPGVLAHIKEEHDEVKSLFEKYEKSSEKSPGNGAETVDKILTELMRHAEMEEQIVYPALKKADSEVYYEAHEEHHVAELLMGEIGNMTPDEVYRAKVTVLAENTRHHIEEEESEAFKALRKLPKDELVALGEQWETTKAQWKMNPMKAIPRR